AHATTPHAHLHLNPPYLLSFFSILLPPPRPTLFPYTTLFRSTSAVRLRSSTRNIGRDVRWSERPMRPKRCDASHLFGRMGLSDHRTSRPMFRVLLRNRTAEVDRKSVV